MGVDVKVSRREIGTQLSFVLNVKAAFNRAKALVGAFSVIVQLCRLIVYSTSPDGDDDPVCVCAV